VKKLLLILFVLPLFTIAQDLPTIYANGGEKEVNWDELLREDERTGGAEELWWVNCMFELDVYASSTLNSQGDNRYGADNLGDIDPRTAWVEGEPGYGIGVSLFFPFFSHLPPNFVILNGYQKSIKAWNDNSRVKKFKIYLDDIPLCYLVLEDRMGKQSFELPSYDDKIFKYYLKGIEGQYQQIDGETLKFEIIEVYKGKKWSDVAISEIYTFGCCFTQNTSIFNNLEETTISNIKKGSKISIINLESDKIEQTKVIKTVKVIHHKILKISTSENQIEITPDHPLYIKGYGLSSLYKVKRLQNKKSYSDLINNVEVLVWNKDTQKSKYVLLLDIKVLKGDFETYNILEMEGGKNFIANGFITSVY